MPPVSASNVKKQKKGEQKSVFTAAMLEERNNKIHLHKNEIYFPKENHFIVSLLQNGRREHTL